VILDTGGRAGFSLALLSVSLLLGACSASSSTVRSDPVHHESITAAEVLLLLHGRPIGADDALLANDLGAMVVRCMAGKGFRYYPDNVSAHSIEVSFTLYPEFPRYDGIAARERAGYGLYANALKRSRGQSSASSAASAREDAYLRTMASAARTRYLLTLQGSPGDYAPVSFPDGVPGQVRAGGCLGHAERNIYGSIVNYALAVTGLSMIRIDFIDDVQMEPDYLSAVWSWARCMRRLDYAYPSPMAAYEEVARQYARSGPTNWLHRREIAVAVADYHCAQRVALLPRTSEAEKVEENDLGTALSRELREYARIYYRAVGHARRKWPSLR
jgi:hypothetical protein